MRSKPASHDVLWYRRCNRICTGQEWRNTQLRLLGFGHGISRSISPVNRKGISIRARAIFSPVECLYKSFIPEAWLSNKGESAARTTAEVFDCDHLRTQTMSFTNCLRKRLRRIQQSLFSPVETRAWDIGFNGIDCITSARQLLFPLPSSPGCNPAARIVTKVTILLELDRAMTSRI